MPNDHANPPAGPATDARGLSAVDPTTNVLDLVRAAVQRMDDLSALNMARQDDLRKQAHESLVNFAAQRDHYEDVLRQQEIACSREVGNLRDRHATEIRKAETDRIDAIRTVDVGNVSRAAEVQATQAKTLETVVATSAETLRKQVESTATAARADQATALAPINKSIDELRQAQYQQQGERTQRTDTRDDPALQALLAIQTELATQRGQRTARTESSTTNQWVIGTIISVGLLVAALLTFAFYVANHH